MAKSNYPHKQRNGGSNRGALIALLVLLIIAAAVFLLRSCTDGKTPDPAPGGIVYDPGAVEGGWNEADTDKIVDALNEKVEQGMINISIKAGGNLPAGRLPARRRGAGPLPRLRHYGGGGKAARTALHRHRAESRILYAGRETDRRCCGMNAYTRQDLSVMQAWPLDRKIRVTQAKIIDWYHHYGGKVAVSFSGGKDSTILLNLARRAFPDIPAVFVDTGLEYPEIREFVKTVPNVTWLRPEMPFSKVISEYGYPVVSKDVARRIRYAKRGSPWALCHLNGLNADGTPSKFNERYQKWRVLLDAPFPVSDACCAVMKERPLHRYNRETGRKQIIATMACESARRQSVYLKIGCNAYHKRDPTSQPMSFWTEQDVLEYLRMTGIPYASVYGEIVEKNGRLTTTGAKRTGCMFCMFGIHLEKPPNRFQRMALTHPKQYDFCIHKLGCGKVLDFLGVPYAPNGGETP